MCFRDRASRCRSWELEMFSSRTRGINMRLAALTRASECVSLEVKNICLVLKTYPPKCYLIMHTWIHQASHIMLPAWGQPTSYSRMPISRHWANGIPQLVSFIVGLEIYSRWHPTRANTAPTPADIFSWWTFIPMKLLSTMADALCIHTYIHTHTRQRYGS